MRGFFSRKRTAAIWTALALAAAPVCAAAASDPPTEADLENAFQAVLADPADLNAAFEYARIAAALGDYEAAASSLERMLMFNPDLYQVQVELGVLYFRLGSYATAEAYLKQAIAHKDLPPETRERAETFLAQIEQQVSPHRFAFSVSGGLRYQTNANLAPGNTILSGGTPIVLPNEFSANQDFAVFADFQVRHHYDFGSADGDRLESQAGAYTSRQFEVEEFSLTYLNADTGPRFYIAGPGSVSVRPYLKASALFIETSYYQGVLGGGTEVTIPVLDSWSVGLDGFWQYATHVNSSERPSAKDLDGQEASLEAEIAYNGGDFGVALIGGAADVNASQHFEAYQELKARVFAWKDLPAPVNFTSAGLDWTVTLSAEFLNRNYDAANPAVSPNVRNDKEYRVDGQLIIPVAVSASVFAGVGWQDVHSNLPNYTFDNVTVLGGVNVRF